MRSFLATCSVLAFAATAGAQTLPNPGAMDVLRYDDGSIETVWKVQNPNGPSDYFNMDLEADASGGCIVGLLCNTTDFGGATQGRVGLYLDNTGVDPTGGTPDLSLPVTVTAPLPTPGALDCSDTIYDVPDVSPPSGTTMHVVMTEVPGDSALWLCTDSTAGTGRAYFTLDGYATPAVNHTSADYLMGTASQPCVDNTLWVNGAPSTSIEENDEICILFRGDTNFQPFMVFLSSGGVPIGPAVSIVFFTTLFNPVDGAGNTATLCTIWPCGTGFLGSLGLMAFYKNTGAPGWSFSAEATVTVTNLCPPPPQPCTDWGQRDDGVLDSTIWKVQNPAGSLDWFSTRHGPAPTGVTSVTGIEVASWDFCGTGPSWARVGLYASNTVVDPTGGTPDVSAGGTVVEVVNGAMAPNASDWSYPATFYNTNDGAPANGEHTAVNWAGGDTCVWIGTDMDGTDDTSDCSNIPTTISFFTLDGYATPASQHTIANYMQKIIWN